jgi:hypothetical protein
MAVRDLIYRALREIGAIGAAEVPTDADADDALEAFNAMQREMFGVVVGPRLIPAPATTSRSVENGERCITGASPVTLTLGASPRPGNRFGVVSGVGAVTINPNGQRINGALTATVVTSGSWFYRDDTANWEQERDLVLNDDSIFAPELDEALVYMLAVRLAPSFGEAVTLTPTISALAAQGTQVFAMRYGRRGRNVMRQAA